MGRGGLVAFATETVYGLGAVATDPRAVARIYEAKGRPSLNPLIVHVADIGQAREYVSEWPDEADTLASSFWPGPLTLVLDRSGPIPDLVTAGKATVGVRCPAGRVARGLIDRCGRPLAAPSANRSNRLSPTRAEHVLADLDGRIDLILDSGPTAVGLESTVLDLTTDPVRLLRPGPITVAQLESTLSGRFIAVARVGRIRRPTVEPRADGRALCADHPGIPGRSVEEFRFLPDLEGAAILSLATRRSPRLSTTRQDRLETPELAARWLYDVLHEFDAMRPLAIVVVMPPDRPEWLAVRDRLLRATRPIDERGSVSSG